MFKKLLVLALAASFSLPALAADGSGATIEPCTDDVKAAIQLVPVT